MGLNVPLGCSKTPFFGIFLLELLPLYCVWGVCQGEARFGPRQSGYAIPHQSNKLSCKATAAEAKDYNGVLVYYRARQRSSAVEAYNRARQQQSSAVTKQ